MEDNVSRLIHIEGGMEGEGEWSNTVVQSGADDDDDDAETAL